MQAGLVHVRVAEVAGMAALAPPPEQWMSAQEARRLAGLRAGLRASQFVAGRWLARALLAQACGGAWQDWTLGAAPDGPPQASGPVPAHLSISHSGGLVACAAGPAPLGLDLECLRPRQGLDALIGAVSSAAERAAMPELADAGDAEARLAAFFRLWTLKEAWLKRTGGALFQTMLGRAVAISPAASPTAANACTWRHGDAMLALSAGPPVALAGALPAGIRYWHLAAAAQAA
ncbi:4'-phosphopantetheinyl transferase family protein [Cupriavidus sp. 30B13]|uniref:4'-phosphopantetheinyl transferase family protein n=1 Tax=Cupriavidus sp. 30B13 TaxID=3384241 RepID=UPI003B9076AA